MQDVPPPPQPEIIRTDTSYLSVARKDVPLLLTREKQTERALIRYQLFVRTDVEASQPPAREDASSLPPITCQWALTVYLEREPCFESMTGRMACSERYTVRLDDRERGSETLPLTAEVSTCHIAMPAVVAAQLRLGAAVTATADARFGDDLTRRLTPQFTRAGITAKIRPPKVAE